MGLIKKKDRSEKRASQARANRSPETSSAEESVKDIRPAHDASADTAGDTSEPSFPTELRLAVEAVASADTVAPGGSGSDAYGLRAELEASRRRGDDQPAEPKPETSEPAPQADEPAPEDSMLEHDRDNEAAREPDLGPVARHEPEATVAGPADPHEEPDVASPTAVDTADETDQPDATGVSAGTFASEARARLEALERSIAEKTETLRGRAAELADREGELARTGGELGELESRFAERERKLDEREDELRAEAARLEQEQAIWGEATRESRARLAELQEAVDAKEKELAEIEEAHTAKAAEPLGAELDARADRISIAEDELAARAKKLDDREALVGDGEEDVTERERRLSERETAIAGRDAALDQSEARVAERQNSFDQREAELVAREEILAADREQLDRDRADWEEIMGGAFSRLSELETDLVSSLSLAGMLKRELEGRDANERLDRKAPNPPRPEPEERRGARAGHASTDEEASGVAEPVLAALESNGSSIPKGEAAAKQQVVETDWWARQLGRRKKDHVRACSAPSGDGLRGPGHSHDAAFGGKQPAVSSGGFPLRSSNTLSSMRCVLSTLVLVAVLVATSVAHAQTTAVVTLALSPASVTYGEPVQATGQVELGTPGEQVILERADGETWLEEARGPTDAAGGFRRRSPGAARRLLPRQDQRSAAPSASRSRSRCYRGYV